MWDELLFLSELEENSTSSPFRPEEQRIMDVAQRADSHATHVLMAFVWPVALLSFGAFFAFISLETLAATTATIATCVSVVTVTAQLLSYYATGWAPHIASQRANAAQDTTGAVTQRFLEMAEFLIECYFSQDERERTRSVLLARAVRPALVRQKCLEFGFVKSDRLVDPLEDAVRFIVHDCASAEGSRQRMAFLTMTMRHLVESLVAEKEVNALKLRLSGLEQELEQLRKT